MSDPKETTAKDRTRKERRAELRDLHNLNAFTRDGETYLRCDGFGCNETHPIEHEDLGEPSFGTGRWLGWLYLDLNRPDLFARDFRFCSVACCTDWLERQILSESKRPLSALDRALREPGNELARQVALRAEQQEQGA